MSDLRIRFRHLPDGAWLAGVDGWVDFAALVAEESGSTAEGVAQSPLGLVASASTPWAASAAVCYALGEDLPIEWQTLPWSAQREAHGITQGVCELLGAGRGARRAIDAAVYEEEMRELGVSERVTLTAEKRARLAAAAAERYFQSGRDPDRSEAVRALTWTKVATEWLPGYAPSVRLLSAALLAGYPERRRGRRLMRRAWLELIGANLRNDI